MSERIYTKKDVDGMNMLHESCDDSCPGLELDGKMVLKTIEVNEARISDLESQLSSAKAEISEGNAAFQKLLNANDDLLHETQRLRGTIQRNEDKSVECERLRDALSDMVGLEAAILNE